MKVLLVSPCYEALVDDELYDELCKSRWFLSANAYACRGNGFNETKEMLHHVICGVPKLGFVVDHINGNTLDNRRENLRVVSHGTNLHNQPPRSNTGYKGVHWFEKEKVFLAYLNFRGRRHYLGRHRTAEKAALAYNRKALELYGENARLNNV